MPKKELAQRLFDAGLAPKKVDRLACKDGFFFYWAPPDGTRWRPANSLDDCAYLLMQFRMSVRYMVFAPSYVASYGHETKLAFEPKTLPEMICRLALILHEEQA